MSTSLPSIPYGRQFIDDADIAAVTDALRGDFLTTGPTIARFESAIADYVGARHAVAFANGTATLHAACAAGGLQPGARLATSSLSFVASANCGRYVGALPEFVDIDPGTLNLDIKAVPDGLDALVPVHYSGLPVDLAGLAHRPPLIVEDAAQALGAHTPDGPVGNCAHSEMVSFSLHPVKSITTGEGGVVTTNNDELAERLRRFRTHGIVRRPDKGGWYYEVVDVGMNYRITDIQAALGLSQLAKLDSFIARRHEIALRYDELLADLPLTLPQQAPNGSVHAHHLYPIRVAQRRAVYDRLHARGILVQVHYVPIHHHPAFEGSYTLPNTDAAYEGLLSLPIYPGLTDDDQLRVVHTLTDTLGELGMLA
jgi:UDP-4-amino-4,6-dideoxy-N-acetyl-beta-L-altrosamine transaminase